MNADLDALDERIALLIGWSEQLRSDNTLLRQQLAAAEAETRHCVERANTARARLEALLAQLPAGSGA